MFRNSPLRAQRARRPPRRRLSSTHSRLARFITTPDAHDREAAVVQGLTHLIAKVLVRMEPLPTRLTTASFDLLIAATEMVRHDAPSVLFAIERANPYAAIVREQFFKLAEETRWLLEGGA
jgi:prephenate dehydrogenase